MLGDQQLLRYSRQIMLPAFDIEGQERLAKARVLVVGLGGLGSPAAMYLAAAGVGSLILADGDNVELSNLQRQLAHDENNLGANKAASAAQSIQALNGDCQVRVLDTFLTEEQLPSLLNEVDLVLDASDNFATRFSLNRAAFAAGVPLVSGAAIRSEGQIAVFHSDGDSPCYACLYNDSGGGGDEELSCAQSGVLAPVVGVIGSMQALEAVKFLSGYGEPLKNTLLVFDAWSMQVRSLKINKKPGCPVCG